MKNQNQQVPQMNVDLKTTEGITNADGKSVFQSGVILRKISKFVAGTDNDAIMPMLTFGFKTNMKILGEGIPAELREELKDELC